VPRSGVGLDELLAATDPPMALFIGTDIFKSSNHAFQRAQKGLPL
jgi:hypothetical protein